MAPLSRARRVVEQPGRRSLGIGDDRRDPDAVEGRSAHLQARDLVDTPRGSAPPGRDVRRRTAAAPRPSACTWASSSGACRPTASRRSIATASTSSVSGRCSSPSSPCRPTLPRKIATSPASQPHLFDENVAALMVRPSTGGTRKPEPVSAGIDLGGLDGQRHEGDRGVLDPAELTGRGRARRRAAAARPRCAGAATMTASTSTTSGAIVGPTTSRHPSAVRLSSRTIAPVRTCPPRRSMSAATAHGNRPTPPTMPAKTGSTRRTPPGP